MTKPIPTCKNRLNINIQFSAALFAALIFVISADLRAETINRRAIVSEFSPQLKSFDINNPFTLGNGKFAFTADVTGLQSFGEEYFAAGFPAGDKSALGVAYQNWRDA